MSSCFSWYLRHHQLSYLVRKRATPSHHLFNMHLGVAIVGTDSEDSLLLLLQVRKVCGGSFERIANLPISNCYILSSIEYIYIIAGILRANMESGILTDSTRSSFGEAHKRQSAIQWRLLHFVCLNIKRKPQ